MGTDFRKWNFTISVKMRLQKWGYFSKFSGLFDQNPVFRVYKKLIKLILKGLLGVRMKAIFFPL